MRSSRDREYPSFDRDSGFGRAADVPRSEYEFFHVARAGHLLEILPRLDQRISEHRVLHEPEAKRQHELSANARRHPGIHDDEAAARSQLAPTPVQHGKMMRNGIVGQTKHHAIK